MKPEPTALVLMAFTASVTAQPPQKAPSAHRTPHHQNRTVALLSGAALHLSQDAAAMTRDAAKQREKKYGHSKSQTRIDRSHLKLIHKKSRYFRAVKRRNEGRR